MLPNESFFAVFEYRRALPAWRFDAGEGKVSRWRPERRTILVKSPAGGPLILKEQFFPGWKATVDGNPVPLHLDDEAFQSIEVPAGEHRAEFLYRPASVIWGGAISIVSAALIPIVIRRRALGRVLQDQAEIPAA